VLHVLTTTGGRHHRYQQIEGRLLHVVGELVVAHEVSLAVAAVTNLKHLLLVVCGGPTVIVVTPFQRLTGNAASPPVTACAPNLPIPGSREKYLRRPVRRLSSQAVCSSFSNCKVVAAGDLRRSSAKLERPSLKSRRPTVHCLLGRGSRLQRRINEYGAQPQ
jgi:hypothetical protein